MPTPGMTSTKPGVNEADGVNVADDVDEALRVTHDVEQALVVADDVDEALLVAEDEPSVGGAVIWPRISPPALATVWTLK